MLLTDKDKALLRLFATATHHQWEALPDLGKLCYAAGATLEELRGCVRHLIVVAGYASCLAATNHLHAARLLDGDTPGKVTGPPGDAFDLVYANVATAVRHKVFEVDPVLTEYIRLHLYGDVYSSPGVSLRQKQLLMCAFLGEANMPEQLFGHLLAALRFGNDKEACLKAIDIGFESSPHPSEAAYKAALNTFEMAYRKFKKDFPDGPPLEPEVENAPDSVCVPALVHTAPRTPTAAKKPELAKGIGEGLKIMTLDVDAGLGGLGGLPTP